jgi:hypothetical protein
MQVHPANDGAAPERRMHSIGPIAAAAVELEVPAGRATPADATESFAPLTVPELHWSVAWMLFSCGLLQLVVAVPYAANERTLCSPALRGVLVGIYVSFFMVPNFLVNAPILVRGEFHRRYFLCIPITVSIAVGAAYIPVGDDLLGFVSIGLVCVLLSFVVCVAALNVPLLATDAHKAMDQSCGPPVIVVVLLYFGLLAGYNEIAARNASPFIGIYLLVSGLVTEASGLGLLTWSFEHRYVAPKSEHISAMISQRVASRGEEGAPTRRSPPILGRPELAFSNIICALGAVIDNTLAVGGVLEALVRPKGRGWLLAQAISTLVNVLKQGGVWQRLWSTFFRLFGCRNLAAVTSIKLAYIRSQHSSRRERPSEPSS